MPSSVLVVPCFNEERRLDRAAFEALAKERSFDLWFVDDGSRDGTLAVLEELARKAPGRTRVLRQEKNSGKGEAVRRGMLEGLEAGASVVGFADADLATPGSELVRLRSKVQDPGPSVVVGSRVLLVDTQIERQLSRHLLGRVFATIAANILGMPFYDTQCGAKFFRDTPALRAALSRPFTSRWAFDIELLGRLRIGAPGVPGLAVTEFKEVPLERWIDIPDSKLKLGGMARTLADLVQIDRELSALRRAARQG